MASTHRSFAKVAYVVAGLLVAIGGACEQGGPGGVVDPEIPPDGDGTSPSIDPAIFPAAGETAFLSANENEQLSAGANPYGGRTTADNALRDMAEGAADGTADPAAPPTGEPMPAPDPSREIVEADLFKVEGNLVYVLNRFRGLIILDLSEPDEPVILGRLPFQAVPLEMYVRDGRAYMVVSDYFTYWMFDPDADPLGFHGSQIIVADVSDPARPREMGALQVDGEVTDTRMIGDVLYAVSKRNPDYWRYNTADWEDTTWVVSLNIADPANIHEVDRIEFSGTSTLIHTAEHAIFVAATDPNYYLTDPGHEQETLVTYVDISDPAGDIAARGHIYVPGQINDKFKMDYYDATFRVLTSSWYSRSEESLYVVDVQYPDDPKLVGSLELRGSAGDWLYLQATRFSGPRAYAMTSYWDRPSGENINELHVLDLTEPTDPIQASTMRITGSVTHFEVRGDNTRLLSLGQGHELIRESPYRQYRYYTRLALFDVADATAPRELSHADLGLNNSYSAANNDYKALKVIESLNLILLPLSYNTCTDGYNCWETGTQLVDWIGDALVERGRVENIDAVERAFPVGDRVVATSTRRIQVINALDRDNPVVTAKLDVIRNVYDIYDVQGQEVQLVGDAYDGRVRFFVIPFGEKDDVPPLASLELPFSGAPAVFRDGDIFHMIGWEGGTQVIRNADFSDPLHPVLRGELVIADALEWVYSSGYGYYYRYWNANAGLPLENRILPFTVRKVVEDSSGRRDFESWLRFIELSNPDSPRIVEATVQMNEFPFINKVTHGTVLHSTHVEQATSEDGATLLYHVRSYVDRIDVSDVEHPVVLAPINIPGWLVDTSEDGKILYTIDYQWDDFGRRRNSLNTLRVDGDSAVLVEVLPVSDQVNRAVFRDRTVWLTTHKYPWWGVHSDTVESRQPYTVLNRVGIGTAGAMSSFTAARLHGYHFDLLDVDGELAYLGSSYPYGVLVLDVADPSEPAIVSSARTVGYISRIVPNGDHIYAPLGMFGVHRMPAHP